MHVRSHQLQNPLPVQVRLSPHLHNTQTGGGVDGYGGKLSHHHHPAGTSKARGSRSIGRPGYGRTANPNPADPVPRQRLTSALRHLVCYYNLQTLGAGARSLFSPSFPVAHWATMVRSLQKGLTKTRCPFCSL